jgi:hypothetical protein
MDEKQMMPYRKRINKKDEMLQKEYYEFSLKI